MKKLIILLISCLIIANTFGTSIVIIITKTGILVATDSKNSGTYANGPVSKIIQIKEYYCAIAGMPAYYPINHSLYSKAPVFDLKKIISDAVNHNRDFKYIEKLMLDEWHKELIAIYQYIKINNPQMFFNESSIRTTALFIVSRNGVIPFFKGYITSMKPQPFKLELFTQIRSSNEIKNDSSIIFELSSPILYQKIENESPGNLMKIATKIIEKKISENKNQVGKPIDVLWIDKKREIWLKRQKTTPIKM
jgi:hypothetical protein